MKIRKLIGVAAALCSSGLATSVFAQSANDLCANAAALTVDTPTAGAIVALDNSDGPSNTSTNNGCGTTFHSTAKTVWYTFTPGTTGLYEVSLCASTSTGSMTDTRVSIFAATDTTPGSVAPCTGSVAALACNDDSCGLRSNFNVNLTGGTGYIIRVTPFTTSTTAAGTFTILVHGPQSTPAPGNDDCLSATALTSGSPLAGDLTNATGTSTTLSTCGTTTTSGNDVWYTIAGGVGGAGSVDVCGNFDSVVSVYTAVSTCAAPVSLICNDDTLPTGCLLHGSRATFTAAAGATYIIRVSGVQHSVSTPVGIGPAHGSFTITATVLPNGTCCNLTTGACTFVTQATCGANTWTQGGACDPSPCAGAGSCCTGTGTCSITAAGGCTATTSTFTLGTLTCTPNPCTALLGACCTSTGASCSVTTANGCVSPSTHGGPGSTCAVFCPTGACCIGTACSITAPTGCAGVFQGNASCTPNPCVGRCCTGTACTLVADAAACSAGTFYGAGSTCGTAPCPDPACTPALANDFCANALAFGGAGFQHDSNNLCASTDPMPAVCASSARDAWYMFTPTASGNYSIRTCGGTTASSNDTVLSIHTACPTAFATNLLLPNGPPTCPSATNCNCSDDSCTGGVGPSTLPSVALTGGTSYWIRVAQFGTVLGQPYSLIVGALVGTCCDAATGACSVTTLAACPGPSIWTVGAICSTTACPGICCAPAGTCTSLASAAGCAVGSTYTSTAAGGTCTPNTCPIASGACCRPDGTCSTELGTNCASPNFFFANVACPGQPCPGPVGSCCNACGTVCTYVASAAGCAVGSSYTAGGVCTPSPCIATSPVNDLCGGAIALTLGVPVTGNNTCATDTGDGPAGTGGDCDPSNRSLWYSFTPTHTAAYSVNTCTATTLDTELVVFTTDCSAFTQIACSDDGCGLQSSVTPVLTAGTLYHVRVGSFSTVTVGSFQLVVTNVNTLGSCCATSGGCSLTDSVNCTGAFTPAGSCPPNICPQPGGCCDPTTGTCSLSTVVAPGDCAAGSNYLGDGVACTPILCPLPTGACCCGSNCSVVAPAACVGPGQVFVGGACTPFSFTVPCCRGDYNKTGAPPTVQDIFDFLAGYFGNNTCADTNDTGGVPTVQDIFDFLAAYFGGC